MASEFDITETRLQPVEAPPPAGAPRRAPAEADDFFADDEISWEDETDARGGQGGQLWVEARRRVPLNGERLRDVVVRRRIALAAGGIALLGLVLGLALGLSGGGGKPLAPVIPVSPAPSAAPAQSTTPAPAAAAPAASRLAIAIPAASKPLKLGDQGPAVSALQRALAHLNYAVGTADGVFGQKTRQAVIAFQQAQGLSPDGVVGPQTARAVNRALAAG